jgi:hypothetical protein
LTDCVGIASPGSRGGQQHAYDGQQYQVEPLRAERGYGGPPHDGFAGAISGGCDCGASKLPDTLSNVFGDALNSMAIANQANWGSQNPYSFGVMSGGGGTTAPTEHARMRFSARSPPR